VNFFTDLKDLHLKKGLEHDWFGIQGIITIVYGKITFSKLSLLNAFSVIQQEMIQCVESANIEVVCVVNGALALTNR
jgi:hypothetical protein